MILQIVEIGIKHLLKLIKKLQLLTLDHMNRNRVEYINYRLRNPYRYFIVNLLLFHLFECFLLGDQVEEHLETVLIEEIVYKVQDLVVVDFVFLLGEDFFNLFIFEHVVLWKLKMGLENNSTS